MKKLFISNLNEKDVSSFTTDTGLFLRKNFDELKNTSNKIIDIINNYFGAPTTLLKKIIIADDSNIVLSF